MLSQKDKAVALLTGSVNLTVSVIRSRLTRDSRKELDDMIHFLLSHKIVCRCTNERSTEERDTYFEFLRPFTICLTREDLMCREPAREYTYDVAAGEHLSLGAKAVAELKMLHDMHFDNFKRTIWDAFTYEPHEHS